jgi:hypothetical protein
MVIGEPFTLDIAEARRELAYRPVMTPRQGPKDMENA